jgi:coenzyme F420-reducing hydrogenase gamma subunit
MDAAVQTAATAPSNGRARPRLAVFKFASCDGCQLSILDCEDELLALADAVDIVYFLEAIRRPLEGEFDVTLVEGSVSTPDQEKEIRDVRARTKFLITLGACASNGGIQGLRNYGSLDNVLPVVYASPQYIETLATSRPTSHYVNVDLELQGCPINKNQLLSVLAQMLLGAQAKVPSHALCLDCKRKNLVCVLVAHGTPCMGPVTNTGCGVLCPSYDRACYSCFGPAHQPNTAALARRFQQLGLSEDHIRRLFQSFYANAPLFEQEAMRHGQPRS